MHFLFKNPKIDLIKIKIYIIFLVDGVLKLDSRLYVKFEAEMTLMESIVSGLGKLIKQPTDEDVNSDYKLLKGQIMNGMNNLLQMLLGVELKVRSE